MSPLIKLTAVTVSTGDLAVLLLLRSPKIFRLIDQFSSSSLVCNCFIGWVHLSIRKKIRTFLIHILNLNAVKNRVGLNWRLEKFLSYFLSEINIYWYTILCQSVARRWICGIV